MQGSGPPSTDEILQGATEHHKCGRLAEAERGYAAIVAREPEHFVALHRLALLCLQPGRLGGARHPGLGEARHLVEAALRVDPDAEPALLNKGAILLALKCPEQALAVFTRVVRLNPTAADAHFNIGNALMTMDHPADAAASFARVLSL